MLRPQGVGGSTGGPLATSYLPTYITEEDSEIAHDINTLPHMYGKSEMNRLFKVLGAPPAGANVEDWEPIESVEGQEYVSVK